MLACLTVDSKRRAGSRVAWWFGFPNVSASTGIRTPSTSPENSAASARPVTAVVGMSCRQATERGEAAIEIKDLKIHLARVEDKIGLTAAPAEWPDAAKSGQSVKNNVILRISATLSQFGRPVQRTASWPNAERAQSPCAEGIVRRREKFLHPACRLQGAFVAQRSYSHLCLPG